MNQKDITLLPSHMSATSVIVAPDKSSAIITCYQHEFTHTIPTGEAPVDGFQVRADLTPKLAVSLSPDQAVALCKSLQAALEDHGLWKN
ncbi:hypothetical protein EHI88_13075 [Cronobacter malonaticus]|nr:hypothetical protein [Cronobacter malonaticus]